MEVQDTSVAAEDQLRMNPVSGEGAEVTGNLALFEEAAEAPSSLSHRAIRLLPISRTAQF